MADGTPAAAAALAEEMTPQQRERQLAVDAYTLSLRKNREAEVKVKELRLANVDLDKEYTKTEDDLKALQSVGQIIGEVLKAIDDEKYGDPVPDPIDPNKPQLRLRTSSFI